MRKKRIPWLQPLQWICLLATLWFSSSALAHEMRPALLDIRETQPGVYDIKWKIPRVDNQVIRLQPIFPPWFEVQLVAGPYEAGDGALYLFRARAKQDIHRMQIRVEGIENSLVDVWVQVQLLAGSHYSMLIQPNKPAVALPAEETFWRTAVDYIKLGIEHILMGVDHLLFVLALLLLVKGRKRLFWTISAFTLAHSITLSLAALQWITLPGPPVEATIALSIVFLAWEYLKFQQGEPVYSAQYPWVVAFLFGLLHGLGFAGALQSIGLPQTQVPAALGFFNVGVEIGQLAFVVCALALGRAATHFFDNTSSAQKVLAYLIGSIASFWLIDRVIGFWN